MRIPANIVEQVRDGADILNIVQDYVRMKKAGKNYIGLCPFHEEKTASFNVNPTAGYYKCFGCGRGGDAITFIMEIERLEFVDAIRWLADRMGIQIPEQATDQKAFEEKEVVYSALRFAAKYYSQTLKKSASALAARQYLHGRGITGKTIERFQLGYAPNSWDSLLKEAERQHIKLDTLLRAGLVVQRENKTGYYDRFRNRVMFPVWSHVGKIIGFGGRVLEKTTKAPKYLNSPETEVYHKKYVLYGLYQSKRTARQQDRILLVEGYTDVLALDQAGISSVACCGTALTPEQVTLLGRFVKEIQLLYDSDEAGVAATERAIDCVLQSGLVASVVSLPKGEDPDSFVHGHGADKFNTYLQNTTRDWLESLHDAAEEALRTPQGKRQELSKVAERIAWLKDQLLQKLYIQKASQLFHLLEGDIAKEVARYVTRVPTASVQPEYSADLVPETEKVLLQVMLEQGTSMIEYILGHMSIEEFQEGVSRELVNALLEFYHDRNGQHITEIRGDQLQISESTSQLVAGLLTRQHQISERWKDKKISVPELNEDAKRVAKDCMRQIKTKFIKAEIKDLQKRILNSGDGSGAQLELHEEYRMKLEYKNDLENLEKDLFGD